MRDKKLVKELLLKQTRQKLLGFVKQKIDEPMVAEEIVQESLISAWNCLETFKGGSSLLTWVMSIAKHEVADYYRKKKLRQMVFSRLPWLENLVSQALGPELAYQELETKRRILMTFKGISEGYCKILRLKYVEGLSMKQIAQNLNISVKAVESRLTRARLAFVKVYGKREEQYFKIRDFDIDQG